MQTIGTSPKAKAAAALVVSLGTLAAVLIPTLIDDPLIAGAVIGVVLAALAFAGAYLAPPGEVVPLEPVGPASDALLPDDVKARIDGEAGYTLVEVGLFLVLLAVAAAVVVAFVT